MPEASAALSNRRVVALVALALLALAAALLPSTAVAQEPDNPPIIYNPSVSPTSLPFEGGSAVITADVLDEVHSAPMVYADVSVSGDNRQSVQMLPAVIHEGGLITYSGIVGIPPNYTDSPVTWGVVVQAADFNGGLDEEVAGEITVDAQPQFDEPPTVSDPSVAPRELASSGGPVTIGVSAFDTRGISEVYASVSLPAGGTSYVTLQPVSSSRFEGVFVAPPNTGTVAAQYAIAITALDDIGQPGSLDAGVVTVAAPPPPIASGRLTLSPATLSFGAVTVGGSASRSVVLRNPGRRSSPAIRGVLVAPQSPFALNGAGPQGVPFSLRGGEVKTIRVQFRPTLAGPQQGTIAVTRLDGGQPGLTLRLSGRGVARR